MTKTAYYKLKAGAILQWPSGLVRTIIQGPADKGGWSISVPRFRKPKQHHFQRLTVTYVFDDLPPRVKVIGATKKLCLRAERLRLVQNGFDLKEDVRNKAAYCMAVDKAFGRKICARTQRLVGELCQ